MRIFKPKILYFILLSIYSCSIISSQFFHSHKEEHRANFVSFGLHSHLFDKSSDNDHINDYEIQSVDNNYFDKNHTRTSFNFKQVTSSTTFFIESVEVNNPGNISFLVNLFQTETDYIRDKYVLTEANLPPPLS